MGDLIDRQAAVDALKAQADTMRTWVERYAEQRRGILTAVNIVEDIEPAYVAPVVRCEKCKHHSFDAGYGNYWCNLTSGVRKVKRFDYCSYGERKEQKHVDADA